MLNMYNKYNFIKFFLKKLLILICIFPVYLNVNYCYNYLKIAVII